MNKKIQLPVLWRPITPSCFFNIFVGDSFTIFEFDENIYNTNLELVNGEALIYYSHVDDPCAPYTGLVKVPIDDIGFEGVNQSAEYFDFL